jgi:hypothetical protein
MGKESGTTWPGTDHIPKMIGPMREDNLEQHRAEVSAWFDAFPQARATLEGKSVRAWYGQEAAPVLRLPPLPVA